MMRPTSTKASFPLASLDRLLPAALAVLAFVLSAAPPAVAQETVTWTQTWGTSVSGDTIMKIGPEGWNAGAFSSKAIVAGDGSLEFTAGLPADVVCGLTSRPGPLGYADLDFALRLRPDGSVAVLESGVEHSTAAIFASGDRFRVVVQGGNILYYRNADQLYASAKLPKYPLVAKASIFTIGAALSEASLSGTLVDNVLWTNGVNVGTWGSTLSKSAGGYSTWDAGAISARGIAFGDGYVEFSADTTSVGAIGLSHGDSDQSPEDIDFAFSLTSGSIQVLENGVSRGTFGGFAAGDRLRIAVEDGAVQYRKNGVLLYSSAVAPGFPLLVDTALNRLGSTFSGVVLSGELVDVAVPSPVFSVPSGTYAEPQGVEVMSPDPLAAIRYTTSGEDPTTADSAIGSGESLFVDQDTVLKARAWAPDRFPSGVTTASYTIGEMVTLPVEWTAVVGAVASGNTVAKGAGLPAAWDAGAVSTKAIGSGDGWVESVVEDVGTLRAFGLSHGNSGEGYGDIDFALYINGGTLYAYEGGVQKANLGLVYLGDRLRVVVTGGVVSYVKNGQVLRTSEAAPSYPLLVDAALYHAGSRIAQATLSGSLVDVVLEAGGVPVEWTAVVGAVASGNTVAKGAGLPAAWDAGAVSTKAIGSGDGWVESVVEDVGTLRAFGLSHGNSGEGYGDIDFALYINGGTLYAYEGGVQKANLGLVYLGDRLRVVVTGGVVSYVKNGQVLRTSEAAPTYPLLVDAALYHAGSRIAQATLSGSLVDVVLEAGGVPVEWTAVVGAVASGNTVAKGAGLPAAWDAGAVSTKAIGSGDGWVESVVEDVGTLRAFGLSHGNSGEGYGDIDFALYINGGTLYAYEGGVQKANLGLVYLGDRLRVVVTGGVVSYVKNGQVLRTSEAAPSYPLLVDAALYHAGSRIAQATLSGSLVDVVLEAGGVPVEWTAVVGAVASGNTVAKGAGLPAAWDAGAVSTKAIGSGDGWVESVVEDVGTLRAFGLSHGNSGEGYGDIDFALYINGGTLYAYEGGVQKANLGLVYLGDRLRVVVTGGVVSYVKNGQVLRTSEAAPSYPLLVDAALYHAGSRIAQATLSGSLVDVVLEAGGVPVEWTAVVGAVASGNTVAKGAGLPAAWDAGAVSTKAIGSGDGWVESVVEDVGTLRAFGLSHGNSGEGYGDIDFALYINGGTLYAYEGGVQKANLGLVYLGDRLRVVVTGGVVSYVKNGQVLRTSEAAPTYPLLVDAALFHAGSRIAQATLSGSLVDTRLVPPVISPEGGSYAGPIDLTLTAAAGATIRYTTDGTDPNESSPLYTTPIHIEAPTVIKGRAWISGYLASEVTTAAFEMQAPAPSIAPPGGTYAETVTAVITAPPDSVVRYTTDGSDPTEAATAYSGPLSISTAMTLRARAFRAGWVASPVSEAVYSFSLGALAPPVLSPAGGTYETSVEVSMTAEAGASIFYTTDGGAPTMAANPYGGPLTLMSSTTVRAAAFRPDWTPSPIVEAQYEIKVASPAFDPGPGTYTSAQDVAIGSATTGATITYTTDGSAPLESGMILAPGQTIHVGQSMTIRARAWKSGMTPSAIAEARYEIRSSAVAAGAYHSLALTPDGSVWAWGLNDSGQLGDETFENRAFPVHVIGLSDVVRIAGGGSHSLALRSDGTVWAWGANGAGQLGERSTEDQSVPAQVLGLTDIVEIAGGDQYSLALRSDGSVWAWGDNEAGELGQEGPSRPTPERLTALENVVAIAAETGEHSLALGSDGRVWAWGSNSQGQLGDGTTEDRATPMPIEGLPGIVAIVVGAEHSIALAADGTVWAWGLADGGQLGDGAPEDVQTRPVPVLHLNGVLAIAAGSDHNLALHPDGRLSAWGANWMGQVGDGTTDDVLEPIDLAEPTGVVSMAAGVGHSLALTRDGRIVAWGENDLGQLGIGAPGDMQLSPVAVVGFEGTTEAPSVSPPGGAFASFIDVTVDCDPQSSAHYTLDGSEPTEAAPVVACGASVHLTRSVTLSVRAWRAGYLPSGITTASFEISKVESPVFSPPAGFYTSAQDVSITVPTAEATVTYTTDGTDPLESGSVLAPGETVHVEGTTILRARAWRTGWTPSDVAEARYALRRAGQVSAGSGFSVAVDRDGSVWAWGANWAGQLGDGTTEDRSLPVQVTEAANITMVSAGCDHVLARRADGTVLAWGSNEGGQLGDGTTEGHPVPAPVPGLNGVVGIAAGCGSSFAVKADGTVQAWGANYNGELGLGDTENRLTPSLVSGLPAITTVSTLEDHSLALAVDGSVWAWGANWSGQLGDGTTDPRTVPFQVGALGSGVVSVAAGEDHSLALKADGVVWAWGANESGQLGDGTWDDHYTPAPIPAFGGIRAVASGRAHNLAIDSSGRLWAWGSNSYGELGDGGETPRSSPVQLAVPIDLVEASAFSHSLALASDGSIFAWGSNWSGELGNGNSGEGTAQPVPLGRPGEPWGTAVPQVTPPGGAFVNELDATIGCDPLATARYTVDGSEPVESSPAVACGSTLHVAQSMTLRVRAWRPGYDPSATATSVFSFSAAPPFATPPTGSYRGRVLVGLASVTTTAEIRYTTDGSAPTSESALCTAPLLLTESTSIKARAFHTGWAPSSTSGFTHTVASTTAAAVAGLAFSLVADPTGEVWAWGANESGQLGSGSTDPSNEPIPVPGLANVVALAAGDAHALAVTGEGSLLAWGGNASGQTGQGQSGDPLLEPAVVADVPEIVAAAAGRAHSLALGVDGHVYSWGSNEYGQLGDGTTEDRAAPAQVSGLANVVAIAAGQEHSLALDARGRVWAWGSNSDAQVTSERGQPSLTTPSVVFEGARGIGAGGWDSLAVKPDGSAWGWGRNAPPRRRKASCRSGSRVPGGWSTTGATRWAAATWSR